MITGSVNLNREARIRLPICSSSGSEIEIEAIIDTGFTGSLSLPANIISSLGLPWLTRSNALLANGIEVLLDIHAALVIWDGNPRRLLVQSVDVEPLVGMALLDGYDMHVQVRNGGNVILQNLTELT